MKRKDDYRYQHTGVLCDDETCMKTNGITTFESPTKDNIRKGLRHLIGSNTPNDYPKSGDFFFFYCKESIWSHRNSVLTWM